MTTRDPDRRRSRSGRAPQLRVRCFGTLEIAWDGEAIEGFESQKVRGLFAYLCCLKNRPLTRDHLAAFFWPDKDEESARRNLRQALYNLRGVFPDDVEVLQANRQHVQISPEVECWVDALAFEQALETGGDGHRLDPHRLTEAVGLYRGAFLTGFQIRDSDEFDFWLDQERERLQERAVAALRLLIDSYLDRGEYRLGIQYAQRLVAIDPLSEDAHQKLMQLYAQSGRRNRALAQYDELARVLRRELDVEPLEETIALHERILKQDTSLPGADATGEALGPVVPMAGRHVEYERLGACMDAALNGDALITLVEGRAGIGKTRLIRSFLDAASSEGDVIVLKGSCLDVLPESYQPMSRALRAALLSGTEAEREIVAGLPPERLLPLANLVPEIASSSPAPASRRRQAAPEKVRQEVFVAVKDLLISLCGLPGKRTRSVVLLLDDLQRADPACIQLLHYLDGHLRAYPIWIVAACTLDRIESDHPLSAFIEGEVDPTHRVALPHLDREAIHEIATALVPQGHAAELRDFLDRNTGGLPHLISECINFLRDSGHLLPENGRWALATPLADLEVRVSELEEVIAERYLRLPHSTRRLAALAAISGTRFDAAHIAEAGQEHPAVCQIAFDVMLQRWLIRRASDRWQTRQSEPNADAGATRQFEFASETIWRTIYGRVTPARRRHMHTDLARTLERNHADDPAPVAELLAHHFRAAQLHDAAARYLEAAADKALRSGATETAGLYLDLAREELEQTLESAEESAIAPTAEQIARLAARREALELAVVG